MELQYDDDGVKFFRNSCPLLPLTELSFAIESAAAYLLGRGVWRMQFKRAWSGMNCVNLEIKVKPLVRAKPMTFGMPASLGMMASHIPQGKPCGLD